MVLEVAVVGDLGDLGVHADEGWFQFIPSDGAQRLEPGPEGHAAERLAVLADCGACAAARGAYRTGDRALALLGARPGPGGVVVQWFGPALHGHALVGGGRGPRTCVPVEPLSAPLTGAAGLVVADDVQPLVRRDVLFLLLRGRIVGGFLGRLVGLALGEAVRWGGVLPVGFVLCPPPWPGRGASSAPPRASSRHRPAAPAPPWCPGRRARRCCRCTPAAGERQWLPAGTAGRPSGSQDDLGQFVAVDGAGYGAADPLVGERAGLGRSGPAGYRRVRGTCGRRSRAGPSLRRRHLIARASARGARRPLQLVEPRPLPGTRPCRGDGGAWAPGRAAGRPRLRFFRAWSRGPPCAVDLGDIDPVGRRGPPPACRAGRRSARSRRAWPGRPTSAGCGRAGPCRLVVDALQLGKGPPWPGACACAVVEGVRGADHFLWVQRREEGLPVRVRRLKVTRTSRLSSPPFDLLDPLEPAFGPSSTRCPCRTARATARRSRPRRSRGRRSTPPAG